MGVKILVTVFRNQITSGYFDQGVSVRAYKADSCTLSVVAQTSLKSGKDICN